MLIPEADSSYSEARYNRHVFTYQAISESTDRFSVPISLSYFAEPSTYVQEDRLFLSQINGKDSLSPAAINEADPVGARGGNWWHEDNRGIFDGDAAFYIKGTKVWVAQWCDPSQQIVPY